MPYSVSIESIHTLKSSRSKFAHLRFSHILDLSKPISEFCHIVFVNRKEKHADFIEGIQTSLSALDVCINVKKKRVACVSIMNAPLISLNGGK